MSYSLDWVSNTMDTSMPSISCTLPTTTRCWKESSRLSPTLVSYPFTRAPSSHDILPTTTKCWKESSRLLPTLVSYPFTRAVSLCEMAKIITAIIFKMTAMRWLVYRYPNTINTCFFVPYDWCFSLYWSIDSRGTILINTFLPSSPTLLLLYQCPSNTVYSLHLTIPFCMVSTS